MTYSMRGRGRLTTPSLIDLMSLRLVIPGGLLSSRARFRFTNRRLLCDNLAANCKSQFAVLWTPTLTRVSLQGCTPQPTKDAAAASLIPQPGGWGSFIPAYKA